MHAAPTCHTCSCAPGLRASVRVRGLRASYGHKNPNVALRSQRSRILHRFTASQEPFQTFHLTKIDDSLKSRCLRSSPFAMV